MKALFFLVFCMSLFFANNSAEAQSYPYQQQKQTEELSEEQRLQRRKKRIKRVERIKEILFDHEQLITLKGGVNFSKIDDGLGNTTLAWATKQPLVSLSIINIFHSILNWNQASNSSSQS